MGASYNIIPTSLIKDLDGYLEHFTSIDSHGFPAGSAMRFDSKYPSASKIRSILDGLAFAIVGYSEEHMESGQSISSFEIQHKLHQQTSDLTVVHANGEIQSMMGVKGDFSLLLRFVCGIEEVYKPMIIFSPYDAYYRGKNDRYEDVWTKVKYKWEGGD